MRNDETPEIIEYKLSDSTTDVKYARDKYIKEPARAYLEGEPKKVKQFNLLNIVRIPISFALLVIAFWLALNLSSIIQSGDVAQWMKNWTQNTDASFREYFGNGQVATYEGATTSTNDYSGRTLTGEAVTILESPSIPFTTEGDMPVAIRRILDAYDAEDCSILLYDLKNYEFLKETTLTLEDPKNNYYSVVLAEAKKRSSMLQCDK